MEEAPKWGAVYEYLKDGIGKTEVSSVDETAGIYFDEGVGEGGESEEGYPLGFFSDGERR
jgi:hypothetical protein